MEFWKDREVEMQSDKFILEINQKFDDPEHTINKLD